MRVTIIAIIWGISSVFTMANAVVTTQIPEVEKILTINHQLGDDNAYVALMGINAPQEDYYQIGRSIIKNNLTRLEEALTRRDRNYLIHNFQAPEDYYAVEDELLLDLGEDEEEIYNFLFNDYSSTRSLVNDLMKEREKIEVLLDKNARLMERYRALIKLPRYQSYEATTLAIYPSYIFLVNGLELNLAHILYLINDGDSEKALDYLADELSLSRAMITGENQLYDRIVGTHRYLMIERFIADLMDHPKKFRLSTDYEKLLSMTTTINQGIRDYLFDGARVERNNIMRELAIAVKDDTTLTAIRDEGPLRIGSEWIPLEFDANDTLNFFYEMSEKYLTQLEEASLEELSAMPPFKTEYGLEEIYKLYGEKNISGRHLVKTLDFPDFRDLIYRYYNALIQIDLVALKGEIKEKDIPYEGIGKFIESKRNSRDKFPFNHQTVDWDPEKSELSSPLVNGSDFWRDPNEPNQAILKIRY